VTCVLEAYLTYQTKKRTATIVMAAPTLSSTDASAHELQPAPLWKIMCFACFEAGLFATFLFVATLLTPSQVLIMVREENKNLALGIIMGISGVLNIFVGPIVGWISDKLLHGKRFPLIILGTVFWSASILARMFFTAYVDQQSVWFWFVIVEYALVVMLGKVAYSIASTPYTALTPDLFPRSQYGRVSGLVFASGTLGLMSVSLGFSYTFKLIDMAWFCVIASVIPIVSLVPMLIVYYGEDGKHRLRRKLQEEAEAASAKEASSIAHENEHDPLIVSTESSIQHATSSQVGNNSRPMFASINEIEEDYHAAPSASTRASPSFILNCCKELMSFLTPFCHWNFAIVTLATFINSMGLTFIYGFFLYFVKDLIHPNYSILSAIVKTPEQAYGLYQATVSLFAFLTSTSVGFLADCVPYGRKISLAIGAILCCASVTLIYTTLRYELVIVAAMLWGTGMGNITSMFMAIANEVLPNKKSSAKDLAIWST